MYPANTWVTFYYKVTIGQWGQPNSTIQAWVAVGGQPYQEWVNMPNHTLNQDPGLPGYDMVTLLPYMTSRRWNHQRRADGLHLVRRTDRLHAADHCSE